MVPRPSEIDNLTGLVFSAQLLFLFFFLASYPAYNSRNNVSLETQLQTPAQGQNKINCAQNLGDGSGKSFCLYFFSTTE